MIQYGTGRNSLNEIGQIKACYELALEIPAIHIHLGEHSIKVNEFSFFRC